MIDVKEAVKSASEFFGSFKELFNGELKDVRLEEVELSEDKHFWYITLGYDCSRPANTIDRIANPLADLANDSKYVREYKIFTINSETGEVQSMKIRKP